MADNRSPESRSYNMSRIPSTNTKPEETVRKYLFSKGLRFRKNDRRYPGKPDIVLPKYHVTVFVHGCFWHYHEDCPYCVLPKSNVEFWVSKLEYNRNRDRSNVEKLRLLGWRVIEVWECELKKNRREARLCSLINEILNL
jgi:DNA mismatch endonuclease (patch repair protein)